MYLTFFIILLLEDEIEVKACARAPTARVDTNMRTQIGKSLKGELL